MWILYVKSIGFSGCFMVNPHGHDGGLAFLLLEQNFVCSLSFSPNHIDIQVSLPDFSSYHMTRFYEFLERSRHCQSWNLLCSLSCHSPLPWYVLGDFNDMLICATRGSSKI